MKFSELLAKSSGMSLYQHSIEVADYAKKVAQDITDDEVIIEMSWICGFLHDIGKIYPEFQNHLKNSDSEPVFHNLLGASILLNNIRLKCISAKYRHLNKTINDIVTSVVLYHHPISEYDKNNFKISYLPESYIGVLEEIRDIVNSHTDIFKISDEIYVDMFDESDVTFPDYFKSFKRHNEDTFISINGNFLRNDYMFIVSEIVRFADMHVGNQYYKDIILNRRYHIDPEILQKPEAFDDRFYQQQNIAKELAHKSSVLLQAPAGFGKTLVGILYMLYSGQKKVYWVCPRNVIASGVYETLCNNIKTLGLSNKLSVGLLLTNKYVAGDENCDIIVTNIDNFVRPATHNDSISRSISMLNCTVIMDEFHEYVGDDALFAMFDVFSKARLMTHSKTMYLSATPQRRMFSDMVYSKLYKDVQGHSDKIYNRKYRITFDSDEIDSSYSIYTNSRAEAQKWCSTGIATRTVHRYFMDDDLSMLTHGFIERYRPGGKSYVMSSSPIMSVGLDYSAENIYMVMPIPDMFIQIIGRCNRYSDDRIHHCNIVTGPKVLRSEQSAVNSVYSLKLYQKWIEFLKSEIADGSVVTYKELIDLRDRFNEDNRKDIADFINHMKFNSYKKLGNVTYRYIDKNVEFVEDKKVIGKNQFRTSDNYFCKMKYVGTEEYIENPITMDIDVSDNYNNIDDVTLSAVVNNDYRFKKLKKNPEKYVGVIKMVSKSSDTPLYLESGYVYDKILGVVKNKLNYGLD